MGRELKRVPMNFDYPKHEVWYGFYLGFNTCMSDNDKRGHCEQCRKMAEIKGIPITSYNCPDFNEYLKEPLAKLNELLAPPTGDGYQLWETTSEGSPVSPVFATLDELCEWCEKHATTFATFKASKEEWREMLDSDFVCHQEGNMIFI